LRYSYSCRAVIRQDATLRCDQIKLPYVELVKCLQQQIINILVRNYNITPTEAYDIWYKAIAKKDERIGEIIRSIIRATPEGLPVILNRNPTINYGLTFLRNIGPIIVVIL
jgi:DNA-directed RNA polymerase beta' subunit